MRFQVLDDAPGRTTTLLDTLRQIRQAETDLLDVFGYRGSAQHRRAHSGSGAGYGWLEDLNDAAQNAPLSDAEARGCWPHARTHPVEEQVK